MGEAEGSRVIWSTTTQRGKRTRLSSLTVKRALASSLEFGASPGNDGAAVRTDERPVPPDARNARRAQLGEEETYRRLSVFGSQDVNARFRRGGRTLEVANL